MSRVALASVTLLLLAGVQPIGSRVAAAQPKLPAQAASALTAFLQESVARGDVPGVVVAVVGPEGLRYHEAFGKLNVTRNMAMPKDAIFNIASMTKPVTSAAIMLLIEQKKLKLDDAVATYLPQFTDRPVIATFNEADGTYETRPAKRPITIRHLLTHTSGIGYGFASARVTAMQRRTMLNETDMPLLFDPGDGWAYGASTRVLGQVVEKVSGEKLDAFLQTRILRPLAMNDTTFSVPADHVARVVSTHTRGTGGLTERQPGATVSSQVAGDGGLYSTAADYGRFVQMLLNDGRSGATKVLDSGTVRTMFRNQTGRVVVQRQVSTNPGLSLSFPLGADEDTWGLGFQLATPKTKRPNTRSPGSGSWAGIFNTHFWVDPTTDVGVVVMMQLLPFYDEKAMALLAGVEEQVYRHLR